MGFGFGFALGLDHRGVLTDGCDALKLQPRHVAAAHPRDLVD